MEGSDLNLSQGPGKDFGDLLARVFPMWYLSLQMFGCSSQMASGCASGAPRLVESCDVFPLNRFPR